MEIVINLVVHCSGAVTPQRVTLIPRSACSLQRKWNTREKNWIYCLKFDNILIFGQLGLLMINFKLYWFSLMIHSPHLASTRRTGPVCWHSRRSAWRWGFRGPGRAASCQGWAPGWAGSVSAPYWSLYSLGPPSWSPASSWLKEKKSYSKVPSLYSFVLSSNKRVLV